MSDSVDWKGKLKEWLTTNTKTMPDDLRQLREEFVRRFPKEKLGEMTLEQYALGLDASPDSFCRWLEFRTKKLGSMSGGSAKKHGVWWSRPQNSWRWTKSFRVEKAEDALAQIKKGLVALVKAVEEKRFDKLDEIGARELGPSRNSLRAKPLYLYFPDAFLPINNPVHLRHFLQRLGEDTTGDLHACNRRLLTSLRSRPEFDGFETHQMMRFLYKCLPWEETVEADSDADEDDEAAFEPPPEIARLLHLAARTKNVLLYGPPGTGKTWLVNHFATTFLLHHNVSAEHARQYWQAMAEEDVAACDSLRSRVRAENVGQGASAFWWISHTEVAWDDLFEKGMLFLPVKGLAEGESGQGDSIRFPVVGKAAAVSQIKAGDYVFCWVRRKLQALVALARVRKGFHLRQEVVADTEGIELVPTVKFLNAIGSATLEKNVVVRQAEPFKDREGIGYPALYAVSASEAQELAKLIGEAGNDVPLPFMEFVTFHQSFSYEDFVEGLKPLPPREGEGQIRYGVVPGVFRRVCARAEAAWRACRDAAPKYLLIIDEINRANVAKVLGELITLIEDDKRLGEPNEVAVTLPYSGQRFGVPPNLYILGTMNTADRSIALLDLALRRRFTFMELKPNPALLLTVAGVDLGLVLACLNERVAALLDRDHRIGHSYFMTLAEDSDEDDLRFVWYSRVVPLLQEYFHNDGARLRSVLGDRFVRRVEASESAKTALGDQYADNARHEIVELSGADFVNALQNLASAGG